VERRAASTDDRVRNDPRDRDVHDPEVNESKTSSRPPSGPVWSRKWYIGVRVT